MILYDMHLHSDFSSDSTTPVGKQIESARQTGLHGICLTDHMTMIFRKKRLILLFLPAKSHLNSIFQIIFPS